MSGRRWDQRFLELASVIAAWSKDPSSKVGAVIVRPDRTIASLGFNGFPRGVADDPDLLNDRDAKLARVIHAEENAILMAQEPLVGYSIYTYPYPPCMPCAMRIVQVGVSRVVAPPIAPDHRWYSSCKEAADEMAKAGVYSMWTEPDFWNDWMQETFG